MLRLQDSTALIPLVSSRIFTLIESEDDTRSWKLLVSSRIFTLIESEDDTRSWKFFLGLLLKLYHNAIPSRGWGYIFIGC
jgi:hypothetical protein